MPFVSDTGPILSFARASRIDLLHAVAKRLIIPDAVYHEIVGIDPRRPGVDVVQQIEWIKRRSIRNRTLLKSFPKKLHTGEREAITLAEELNLPLLVDDHEARSEAQKRGIPYLGSLRVLQQAKITGLITGIKPALDELKEAGLYISDDLYQHFLREQDEWQGGDP